MLILNINQLKDFVTVAECGSINKAARELYISQPHLSNIIKDLEKSVGFELFNRTSKGVTLTEAGEHFLKHSRLILREVEVLKSYSPRNNIISDKLRVSMTKFTHVMECFNKLCSKKEDIDEFTYVLNEGNTREVITDITSGYTDIGIIHYDVHESNNIHELIKNSGLKFEILGEFEPEICISKNHELFKKEEKISLNNLKDYGFVRYLGQYEDFIYNILKKGFHDDLNNSNKIIYVYGRSTLLNLISISNFYTIGIKEFENQKSMFDVVSVPIDGCESTILFSLITRKDESLNDTSKEFIKDIKELFERISDL